MNPLILGTLNEDDAGMLLLSRLESLEEKPFEEVGMATLNAGCIRHHKQHRPSPKSFTLLTKLLREKELENQLLIGPMGIAYARCSKAPEDEATPYGVELCANQELALVYYGLLDNPAEVRDSLLELGYPYLKTDGELIHNLINHYLTIEDIAPIDAITLALARLNGYFAIMVLSAEPDLLIVARKGCPLAFSLHDDAYYLSSEPEVLTRFSKKVIQLEEGTPAVLLCTGQIEM